MQDIRKVSRQESIAVLGVGGASRSVHSLLASPEQPPPNFTEAIQARRVMMVQRHLSISSRGGVSNRNASTISCRSPDWIDMSVRAYPAPDIQLQPVPHLDLKAYSELHKD